MKRVITILAFMVAILSMLLIPATFIGNTYFAGKMATLPFMKINPVYSGGDSARSYRQDSMLITINKPVFESLFGPAKKGFVQVKFAGELPENIQSDIDYDDDGIHDFNLMINTLTGETRFNALTNDMAELAVSSRVKDYWIVRVNIPNNTGTAANNR